MFNWLIILELVIVLGFSVFLLCNYPTRDTRCFVHIVVFISYLFTFGIMAIVPFDVYVALGGEGDNAVLLMLWKTLYWTVFVLCWFILPIMKGYYSAGEFTFLTKFCHVIYIHLRSTLVFGGLGVAFIFYLFMIEELRP